MHLRPERLRLRGGRTGQSRCRAVSWMLSVFLDAEGLGLLSINGHSFLLVIVVSFWGFVFLGVFLNSVHVGFGNPCDVAIGEIIKQGGAVCLRPDADFSGILEGSIFPPKGLLAVKGNLEIIILEIDTQRVPLVGGDLGIDSFLFAAFAF